MHDKTLTEHLDFVVSWRGLDEAAVLAQALRTGVEALYREALIEGYLQGKVPRETALQELGPEQLADVDYQRDALRRDVEWGLQGA
jgi:hypothetical protein